MTFSVFIHLLCLEAQDNFKFHLFTEHVLFRINCGKCSKDGAQGSQCARETSGNPCCAGPSEDGPPTGRGLPPHVPRGCTALHSGRLSNCPWTVAYNLKKFLTRPLSCEERRTHCSNSNALARPFNGIVLAEFTHCWLSFNQNVYRAFK